MVSLTKTHPRRSGVRNKKSFGDEERECPIVIPVIVGMIPIRVEPLPVIVPVRVEHARIAVGIVRSAAYTTAH